MSREFQAHMFDPFSQEYNNPERPKGSTGTGLGLSIVRKVVDMMGGTLEVESELGKGTTVRCSIVFPDAARDPAYKNFMEKEAENRKEADGTMLFGRVLLAEDNPVNTEIALRILERFGMTAECAENGRIAADMFAKSEPGYYHAILMDIQMPVMNGYESTRIIRAMKRSDAAQIPILAMTADAFADAMQKGRDAGMTEYLVKPIDPVKLRKALGKALKKK
jgi:CheY-like chemotaxis protein